MTVTLPLILASASPSRRRLLENARIDIEIIPSEIDESALRDVWARESGTPPEPGEVALRLACAKATDVAARHTGRTVLGADQVLVLAGERFDKAADMDAARRHLGMLQGRSHELIAAIALCRDGDVLWTYTEAARLTMRPLSAADIEGYLAAAGPDVLGSVGCYHLEGLGARLFERVEGDFFTILGLPLLALLETLRRPGILD